MQTTTTAAKLVAAYRRYCQARMLRRTSRRLLPYVGKCYGGLTAAA